MGIFRDWILFHIKLSATTIHSNSFKNGHYKNATNQRSHYVALTVLWISTDKYLCCN